MTPFFKKAVYMSFPTITVYGNSDNTSKLRFYNKGVPVKLDYVTKIIVELNTGKELSSEQYPGMFKWRDMPVGVVAFKFGIEWWSTNIFYGKIIVFDEVFVRGIYWGTIRIRSMENTIPGA